jgi:polyphosphate kinase 2
VAEREVNSGMGTDFREPKEKSWVEAELEDSFDEEFEMELDDERIARELRQIAGTRHKSVIDRRTYFYELFRLQAELVKLQDWVAHTGYKLVVLFEGRDAAGKGGVIKRITQRLNPRICRVVALPAPTEREKTQWYFQRYVPHLPAGGEMVLFDRSWYNRAGVERVMGFCTDTDYERFMEQVPYYENLLIGSGIHFIKYYLDISKKEQKARMKERRENPLKQWKISPIDEVAVKHWDDYSKARDAMLTGTHSEWAPWTVVDANKKRLLRINVIRDLLSRIDYEGKNGKRIEPDPDIVMPFDDKLIEKGKLSK